MSRGLTVLDRKLARDLWHLRAQVAAVAAVVMCGTAIFVTMRGMHETLVRVRAEYYREARFADIFTSAKRAPETLAAKIAALPGIAAVDTGISLEVNLDVPGLDEPATGVLNSIPEHPPQTLDRVIVRSGRYIEPGARDEVLLSEAFAKANGLAPGSRLTAVINGRRQALRVVGIAISPEYIYVVRPTSGLPDDRRYGIVWMGHDAVAHAYDMDGAFNRVAVALSFGASEAGTIDALDRMLSRYGSLGAYGRADQPSDRVVSDEINQDRVYGLVLSAVFLGVAAFIVNMVLGRLVAIQRDEIAVMKAFGYRNRTIGVHYTKLALVPVLFGVAAGLSCAWWLGSLLAGIYRDFLYFPTFEWAPDAVGLLGAIGASIAAGVAGAADSVRRVVKLPPAAAMQPELPARFTKASIERSRILGGLSLVERMTLRHLCRQPRRAAFSVVAMAMAVAILVAGRYGLDALDFIIDLQFRMAQREQAMLEYTNPASPTAIFDVRHLAGVVRAEPFRIVPVKIRFRHVERRTAILGLPESGELRAIVDLDFRRFALPTDGLLVSAKLAHSLNVTSGDVVSVEVLEGAHRLVDVPVAGLVDDLIGVSLYMALPALNRLMREGPVTSGAFLAVAADRRDQLYRLLKGVPAVRGVSVKEAMLDGFRNVIARSLRVQTVMNVLFATIIAFGVVYNGMRIALSERARELASLRVLGFTWQEVSTMLIGEQAVLTVCALPLGCLVGYAICAAVAAAVNATQESFRLPLVVSSRTYAYAILVVGAAAGISAGIVLQRIRRLDLVAVLKTRD